ncbi:MAG: extracellular solute-binding protein, partial [Elusimicrobiota bacterium]
KKLTIDANGDKTVDQYGCMIDFWGSRVYPWIWQNNGELFTPDLKKSVVDSPAGIEALQFLVDLQKKYKVTPQTLPNEYKNNVEMFTIGKVGMLISGAWDIQNLKPIKSFKWDIAPLPMNKRKATILGTENYAISSTTKYPEEAWLFYKYLLSAEAQKIMADKLEKQPSLMTVAQYFESIDTGYNRKVLTGALEYAIQPPNLPQWQELSHFWQDELDLIWVGKKGVKAGLTDAAKNINARLAEK